MNRFLTSKSRILNTQEFTLNGTAALHMICLMKGRKILRVHDEKEAVEVCLLYSEMYPIVHEKIHE